MGGSQQSKQGRGPKENSHIFDLLSNMNWRERIFKTFCFRFEYKFYKGDNSKVKYTITWEQFEKDMLNNFFELDTDPTHFFIHNVFEKYFAMQDNEIRVFKVYMLYFPYVLHLKSMEGLNFIDLIFEKVLYNLELEMKQRVLGGGKGDFSEDSIVLDKEKDDLIGKNNLENNKDIPSNRLRNDVDLSDLRSNRNLLVKSEKNVLAFNDKASAVSSRRQKSESKKGDLSSLFENSLDNNLLEYFKEFLINKNKTQHKSFVRTVHVKIFREIMFIYFENNVTLLLKAFKEVLKEFDERQYEDDDFIKKIKSFNHEKVAIEKLTAKNVYKFIDLTLKKLAQKRINLPKFKDITTVELTFDDIYVYLKLNPYFLDSYQCYEEFMRLI